MRIAILGAGKIGEALLAGLRSSDWRDLVVTTRREERADELRERLRGRGDDVERRRDHAAPTSS